MGVHPGRTGTLAVVSMDIRRDLIAPMHRFEQLRIRHFFRRAPYNDLRSSDWDESLIPFKGPLDLLRLLRREKPDILQTVEILSLGQLPYTAAIFFYAVLRRIPLVAGVHVARPLEEKYGRVPARLLRALLQPVVRRTRLFFHVNEGASKNLEWMGVPASKTVRHMYGTWGVDPKEFSPERDGREPAWGEGTVVLFVGRVHRQKGIFDLLEAFQQVYRKNSRAILAILGDGPHRAEARQWALSRLPERAVRFLGTIPHGDLPPYFRSAAVLASPSRTTRGWEEYVGMTNLQAMACAIPVVSTRSGAIPEFVPHGEAGILVEEGDVPGLASALLDLLEDEDLRRRMGAAGRARVLDRYDAGENVRRAERIILERC